MIVTISNEYGTGAVTIARGAAQVLGYELVDEQLPVVVAKRLQTSPEAVEAAEDTQPSVGQRFLAGMELSTPEVATADLGESFDEQCLREVQGAVREYAAHGKVIIMGRGASAILGRRPDILRVFMHAPREWRIHHVMTGTGASEKAATTEVDRIDAARRAYLLQWYDLRWGAQANYDLAIDTSTFEYDEAVQLLAGAVRLHAR